MKFTTSLYLSSMILLLGTIFTNIKAKEILSTTGAEINSTRRIAHSINQNFARVELYPRKY